MSAIGSVGGFQKPLLPATVSVKLSRGDRQFCCTHSSAEPAVGTAEASRLENVCASWSEMVRYFLG